MKIKHLTAIIFLFITACTASQHLQPADADMAVAQQRIPGITMEGLQSGYKIYRTSCSGCHRLHDPKEYTANEWKHILSEMFTKAKLAEDKQKELVSNFLLAKSR